MAPTRWGIAGCGKISSDFANAILTLGPEKHVIAAAAARSKDSAQKFGEKFGAKKFYDQYSALAEDPDVDAVYIGTINTTHMATAKMMLAGRKPVLCEKPLTMKLSDTKELLACAKQNDTFLMEAIWSRHFPVYKELQKRLDKGEVGEVTQAHVTFGVPIAGVDRVNQKDLGGSAVMDIGIYCVQFLLYVMGDERPLEIKAMGLLNDQGVDVDVTCLMKFSNDRFGTFMISSRNLLPNEGFVSGTKGTIKVASPFWCPLSLTGPSGTYEAPLIPSDRQYNFDNSQGLHYQAEELVACLNRGQKQCCVVPHNLSLLVSELLQTIREQIGVTI